MFDKIINFFKNLNKKEKQENSSKDTAKERLHLVLMQDRANVSADYLELMKHEIIEVIKKYVDVDEQSIDVRLTNKQNDDGTTGAPALYANIPILNVRNDMKKETIVEEKTEEQEESKDINDVEEVKEEVKQDDVKEENTENNDNVEQEDIIENEDNEIVKEEETTEQVQEENSQEEIEEIKEEINDEIKKEENLEEEKKYSNSKKKNRKKN